MINIIAILVLLITLGGAIAYIVKSKKGVTCIGCPAAGNCPSKQHHQNSEPGSCSCHSEHS